MDWQEGEPPKDGKPYEVLSPRHSGALLVRWSSIGPRYCHTWKRLVPTSGLVPVTPIKWREPEAHT